jgi:plasmid stability protein
MSTLVIKNLPEDLHEKLKEQAKRNHRSVTKEVVSLIECSVAGREANRPPRIAEPRDRYEPDIDEIRKAIEEGRFARYGSLDEVNEWVDELRQDRDVAP